MTAMPAAPPGPWPRRRRVAGYARGSASAGAVPVRPGHGRERFFLEALRARLGDLPGVLVEVDREGRSFARAARTQPGPHTAAPAVSFPPPGTPRGPEVRLPPEFIATLARRGWVAAAEGTLARLWPPRSAAECDTAWRIIRCALDYAAAAPSAETGRADTLLPAAEPAFVV